MRFSKRNEHMRRAKRSWGKGGERGEKDTYRTSTIIMVKSPLDLIHRFTRRRLDFMFFTLHQVNLGLDTVDLSELI
jgi:hypothetical protein